MNNEERNMLSTIFEGQNELVLIINRDMRIVFATEKCAVTLGFSATDYPHISEVLELKYLPILEETFKGSETKSFKFTKPHKKMDMTVTAAPVMYEQQLHLSLTFSGAAKIHTIESLSIPTQFEESRWAIETYITMICSAAQMIGDDSEQSPEKYKEIILRNAMRIKRLTTHLFNLSNNGGEYHRVHINICDFLKRTVSIIQKHLGNKCILTFESEKSEILCSINITDIENLVCNIISNAVRFCEQKPPKIKIVVIQEYNEVIIRFIDNGIGISEKVPDVFMAGYTTRAPDGSIGAGLGLFISKITAMRHKGDLTMEQNEQGGSTFVLTLSKSKAASSNFLAETPIIDENNLFSNINIAISDILL